MKAKFCLLPILAYIISNSILQSQSTEIILVGNNKGGSVTIIDAWQFQVIKTIDIIPDKEEQKSIKQTLRNRYVNHRLGPKYVDDLDVLPDGKTLVISRPFYADIAAFDLNTEKLLWRIPLKKRPDHQVMTSDGKFLYVSLLANGEGVKIDLQNQRILGYWDTGERPHSIQLNKTETRLYNGSLRGKDIVVIDTKSLEQVDYHSLPEGVRPFKITDNEQFIYAQLSYYHGIVEYDIQNKRITRKVDLPIPEPVQSLPKEDYPFEAAHHGIGFSGEKEYMSIAATVSDYVGILTFPDLNIVATVDTGIEPSWITDGFDGDAFFVSARGSDKVYAYSYCNQSLITVIDVGAYPQRMARAIWIRD